MRSDRQCKMIGIGNKRPPRCRCRHFSVSTRNVLMTCQEADTHLANYRDLLKAWTIAVAGFSDHYSDALFRQLEDGQDDLAQIALDYPEKSHSIDMLISSRSRTWAGFAAERLPQPPNRRS